MERHPSLDATKESASGSETFLVCDVEQVVVPRQVSGPRYLLDQLINPDTISFTPGGIWLEDILLYGRFATASETKESIELMKILKNMVRKNFRKLKAYYLGAEAEEMLDNGKRLTIAAQSPPEYNLVRN